MRAAAKRTRRTQRGFTLIELMIVVVIIAILASIAYPSYREYVLRSERTQAKTALMNTAQQLERCFTQFNRYDHADCAVAFPFMSERDSYEIDALELTATRFQLEAERQAPADPRCGDFRLSHTGQRGSLGNDNTDPNDCW